MSPQTIDRLAECNADYMCRHEFGLMNILFHGGEPLLAGPETIDYAVTTLRNAVPIGGELNFRMQTNGTLVNDATVKLFIKHGITAGISLDGTRATNEQRIYHSGEATYDDTVRGIKILSEHGLLSSILTVIDLNSDAIEIVTHHSQFGVPEIELLWPLGNWTNRPPGKEDPKQTPYADWLIPLVDEWFNPRSPINMDKIKIRFFDRLVRYLCARGEIPWKERYELLGPWTPAGLVVGTDGKYELHDGYKWIGADQRVTGLSVYDDRIDSLTVAAIKHIQIAEERRIIEPCDTCNACPVKRACGGGFHLHRYRQGDEYPYFNPSVYCADLAKLTWYIKHKIREYRVNYRLWRRYHSRTKLR